jgi:hypothetical protein
MKGETMKRFAISAVLLVLLAAQAAWGQFSSLSGRVLLQGSAGSWTVPAGVSTINVYAWGPGGAGGNGGPYGSSMAGGGGGGGGGGAFATLASYTVVPGRSLTYTIGSDTTLTDPTPSGGGGSTTIVVAKGGTAGSVGTVVSNAGIGGTAGTGGAAASCTPTTGSYSGGNGSIGQNGGNSNNSGGGGGGGGAGGMTAAGSNAPTAPSYSYGANGANGGAGGPSIGGTPFPGGQAGAENYSANTPGGDGGSGALAGGGGAGALYASGTVTKACGGGLGGCFGGGGGGGAGAGGGSTVVGIGGTPGPGAIYIEYDDPAWDALYSAVLTNVLLNRPAAKRTLHVAWDGVGHNLISAAITAAVAMTPTAASPVQISIDNGTYTESAGVISSDHIDFVAATVPSRGTRNVIFQFQLNVGGDSLCRDIRMMNTGNNTGSQGSGGWHCDLSLDILTVPSTTVFYNCQSDTGTAFLYGGNVVSNQTLVFASCDGFQTNESYVVLYHDWPTNTTPGTIVFLDCIFLNNQQAAYPVSGGNNNIAALNFYAIGSNYPITLVVGNCFLSGTINDLSVQPTCPAIYGSATIPGSSTTWTTSCTTTAQFQRMGSYMGMPWYSGQPASGSHKMVMFYDGAKWILYDGNTNSQYSPSTFTGGDYYYLPTDNSAWNTANSGVYQMLAAGGFTNPPLCIPARVAAGIGAASVGFSDETVTRIDSRTTLVHAANGGLSPRTNASIGLLTLNPKAVSWNQPSLFASTSALLDPYINPVTAANAAEDAVNIAMINGTYLNKILNPTAITFGLSTSSPGTLPPASGCGGGSLHLGL